MSFFGILVALLVVGATAYYFGVVIPHQTKKVEEEAAAAAKKKKELEDAQPKLSRKEKQAQAKAAREQAKKNNNNSNNKQSSSSSTTTTKQKKVSSHPRYVRRFGGHSSHILAMSISPTGEWMATSGADGQLRVTKVEGDNTLLALSTNVESNKDLGLFKDTLTCLAWSSEDHRTIVATMAHAKSIAFYRMRKKKKQDSMDASSSKKNNKNPYELVELIKRRFSIASKLKDDSVISCFVDQTHPSYCLIITATDGSHGNVVAWDGTCTTVSGQTPLGSSTMTIFEKNSSGAIRLSPDGKFVCSRIEGTVSQVRLYEVQKKKEKGKVEPVFDKIPSKSVMTLIPKNQGKVIDVAFLNTGGANDISMAVVACANGCLQVWNLSVEYRLREEPKLLGSCQGEIIMGEGFDIAMIAAASFEEGKSNRIAVVTHGGALHLFSFSKPVVSSLDGSPESELCIVKDFTIDETHEDGVGDIQFCPMGKTIFTRGKRSKDVFAWKID